MTITLYRASRYLPDSLEDFDTISDPIPGTDFYINLKIYNIDNLDMDLDRIRIHTRDPRTGKGSTAVIGSRLYTYLDIV